MESIQILATTIQYTLISLAIIIGGIWSIYRFTLHREYETNLEIQANITSFPSENGNSVAFIDIILKNIGKRQIDAKPKPPSNSKEKYIYKDERETFYHSCALQIKQINILPKRNVYYSWYNSENILEVNNIPTEINLLEDYESPDNGRLDFGLTPGETAHRNAVLALEPGSYLGRVTFWGNRETSKFHAKLSFWGSREKYDYWNYLFYFQIRTQNE